MNTEIKLNEELKETIETKEKEKTKFVSTMSQLYYKTLQLKYDATIKKVKNRLRTFSMNKEQ